MPPGTDASSLGAVGRRAVVVALVTVTIAVAVAPLEVQAVEDHAPHRASCLRQALGGFLQFTQGGCFGARDQEHRSGPLGQYAGIRSADEIEQKTGLSVSANVPLSPRQPALYQAIQARQGGTHLLAVADPADLSVESLRSLRTALQFAMLHAPNRVIMLTGPTPGIGKSFISANLAAIMAATGKRVLLIEADMRKGHLHDVFGVKRSPGLSELVANVQPLESVLRPQVVAGLDLIPGGAIPPNPAELLLSLSTRDWLQRLQDQYDLVLIDTPPVLAVSDACVLAQRTGTVLLVARAETTTLGELQETAKRLTQAGGSVRGVVFNGLDFKRRYGYGYGYRYQRYDYGTPPNGTKA